MSMSPASSPRRSTRAAAARHHAPDAAPSRVLDPARSITVRPAVVQRDPSPEDEASGSAPNTTGDAVQSILKARKCWRSIKGKEEAVGRSYKVALSLSPCRVQSLSRNLRRVSFHRTWRRCTRSST